MEDSFRSYSLKGIFKNLFFLVVFWLIFYKVHMPRTDQSTLSETEYFFECLFLTTLLSVGIILFLQSFKIMGIIGSIVIVILALLGYGYAHDYIAEYFNISNQTARIYAGGLGVIFNAIALIKLICNIRNYKLASNYESDNVEIY